jgi:hypothetical protein
MDQCSEFAKTAISKFGIWSPIDCFFLRKGVNKVIIPKKETIRVSLIDNCWHSRL